MNSWSSRGRLITRLPTATSLVALVSMLARPVWQALGMSPQPQIWRKFGLCVQARYIGLLVRILFGYGSRTQMLYLLKSYFRHATKSRRCPSGATRVPRILSRRENIVKAACDRCCRLVVHQRHAHICGTDYTGMWNPEPRVRQSNKCFRTTVATPEYTSGSFAMHAEPERCKICFGACFMLKVDVLE
jgi:hypothetical protein